MSNHVDPWVGLAPTLTDLESAHADQDYYRTYAEFGLDDRDRRDEMGGTVFGGVPRLVTLAPLVQLRARRAPIHRTERQAA